MTPRDSPAMMVDERDSHADLRQPPAESASQPAAWAVRVLLLLIVLTPVVGFVWLQTASRTAAQHQLLFHTRDMLIRHVARTSGHWPDSWSDLAEDFEPADANYQTPNLDVLKREIAIDFTFKTESIQEWPDAAPVPRVLWLKDSAHSRAVDEANRHLFEALRARFQVES